MSQGQGATTVTRLELDETLQEGFRSLAELPNEELSDETREQVWRAVSGQLPTAERRALIDRTATDAACAEAWRVAHEMWLAFHPVDRVVPWHRRTSWTSPWLAAAAALAVATTIGLLSLLDNQTGDEFRASPGYVVTSRVAADTPLPRTRFLLQWSPVAERSRYDLRVTTEDLQVLATATDLTGSQFIVPSTQLAAVPDGANVFWQVDASLPTGERITSTTFVVQVR